MWYQSARLITVQIALLFGCFCSVVVATIGYVAAMLLVKIKEKEVGGRVKFEDAFVYAEVARLLCCSFVRKKMFPSDGWHCRQRTRQRRRQIAAFFFLWRSVYTRSISVDTLPGETCVDPIGSRYGCDWQNTGKKQRTSKESADRSNQQPRTRGIRVRGERST
jgi:hypothetical protein